MSIVHLDPPLDFVAGFEIAICFCECRGQILLLQRQDSETSPNKWSLPGGGIHEEETARQCVIREVKEETTIDLTKTELRLFRKVFVQSPEFGDYISHMFYVGFEERPNVKVNVEEHKDFCWVKPQEAKKMDLIRGGDETLDLWLLAKP